MTDERTVKIAPDLAMHCRIDDFTDPWSEPETILLLHGNAESGKVWFAWVPQLARRFRVIRPDMRGYGDSTPMPRDFAWSVDIIADDYIALMDALGAARFHVVGAKLGGTIARRMAARYSQRVQTLTLAGVPGPLRNMGPTYTARGVEFEKQGVEHWARRTIGGRLGSTFPPQGVEWWIRHMGRTAVSTMLGFIRYFNQLDITQDLPKIRCPTLVITTEGSGLGSVEETRAWQQLIPDSKLLVLPGDSYHVAASDADRCAAETLAFIAGAK